MSPKERIIDVAFSQLGYEEGSNNWTKYGEWFGIPNGEWCAMFICWCANQAGISEKIIPKLACCDDIGVWYDERKLYKNSYYWGGNYYPVRGDLILFDWDKSSDSDHIGIVISVSENKIRTIEGNKDNKVKECEYDLYDENIRAFCTPQYDINIYERNKDIKVFINKDEFTPIFSDTYLERKIGYLNPKEKCECYDVFENLAIVLYKVDNSDMYKIGFTDYLRRYKVNGGSYN